MIFPRPIQAVVFDMDGVLFDTETVFLTAMQAVGAEQGLVMADAFHASLVGLTRDNTLTLIRKEFGADFPAEAFHAQCHVHFRGLLESDLRMKPGVIEMLDLLDRRGLPRAIATSSARSSVDHHLGHFGLAHRFDAIIAHGDYAQGKPHPAPYLAAAKALGVDPANCMALEDSHNGVRAGAAAGMMTVMVPDMLPPTDEMRGLTVHIARDLIEVRDLLAAQG